MTKRKPVVGDTWVGVNPVTHREGRVWLARIDVIAHRTYEIWYWHSEYSDHSGSRMDWATNKASAVDECKTSLGSMAHLVRFKFDPTVTLGFNKKE